VKSVSEKEQGFIKAGMEIIMTAIDEVRKLSSSFVTPALNEVSLVDTIEYFAHSFKLSDMAVDFDIRVSEEEMSQGLKKNIYRIIQEQFNNIIKYSGATRVKISLVDSPGQLFLEIADNGKGFDPKEKGKGIGLSNIIYRAEAYNGKVQINSSPGHGCSIKIRFDNAVGQA
jgi:signal transduction histidine kinase